MLSDNTVLSSYGLIVTQEHIEQMKGNKSCGYIYMSPKVYLSLVSDADNNKILEREAHSIEFYNKMARIGKNILPPWLEIECEIHPVGKVVGQEGRHRAAACIKAKIEMMPVFLIAKFVEESTYKRLVHPEDPTNHQWRYIQAVDFPKYAIGYEPVRERLPLETWIGLYE
jgi:hypothetical protein